MVLPGDTVDWEVELVAVVATAAHHVTEADGWSHVAGLTVGQDISERATQFAAFPPQNCLAKSYPIGKALMGDGGSLDAATPPLSKRPDPRVDKRTSAATYMDRLVLAHLGRVQRTAQGPLQAAANCTASFASRNSVCQNRKSRQEISATPTLAGRRSAIAARVGRKCPGRVTAEHLAA